TGEILYSTDLFAHETIDALVSVFQQVLIQGLAHPQEPLPSLPLTGGLTSLRTMGLLEPERADYPRDSSVVDIFRQVAKAHPDRTAVQDSELELTYTELDLRSDMLAAWLRLWLQQRNL